MGKIKATSFIVSNLSLPFNVDEGEIVSLAQKKMKRVGLSPSMLHFRLYKRSIDARKRDDIRVVCSVLAEADHPVSVDAEVLARQSVRIAEQGDPCPVIGENTLGGRPLVVGMGPCGMFAALLLAENGYRPILIDRGSNVEDRVSAVDRFYREKILDTATNIQFGAGGAGTFSDGKLVTRIGDVNCNYVLRMLHRFGAPDDVLTKAKPHIGTDVLRGVVDNILKRVEQLGGTLMYRCRLDSISRGLANTVIAHTSEGDISCGALILAIGHSARDTYSMLMDKGYTLVPKPFSVGVRIEHLQENIDRALFGDHAGDPMLGKGEYNLSDTRGGRGVYTFCMCPGGEVVAAASEEGGVVVNGMSHYARDGRNANAALAVSVSPEDYGNDVRAAIAFQRRLEQAAFALGGSGYAAPIQTVGDFMQGTLCHEPSTVLPTYMNGYCKVAPLDGILPHFVSEGLRRGIALFDKRLSGFGDERAILTAVETRTSAPLTIKRTEALTALENDLVYPCGEGAGYAGGITSAAVDGIRAAMAVMARFSNQF